MLAKPPAAAAIAEAELGMDNDVPDVSAEERNEGAEGDEKLPPILSNSQHK